jgi:hypothetical protein
MPKKQGRAPSCNGMFCGYYFREGSIPYKLIEDGILDIDESTDDDHENYKEGHNVALNKFRKSSDETRKLDFCEKCVNNYGLLISEHAKKPPQIKTFKPKNKKKN